MIYKNRTTYSYDAHEYEWGRLEGMPIGVVLDVVERSLACPEWIKHLKHESSGTGADETLPHRLVWEVVRDLLLGSALHLYNGTLGDGANSLQD